MTPYANSIQVNCFPLNVNMGPRMGSAATCPPRTIEAIRRKKPMTEISPTRPGRIYRLYTPIKRAIGIVAATVNVPQGLSAKAFTTINASTASKIVMIMNVPNSAITPGTNPNSDLIKSPRDRPSRRVEINKIMKSWTAPAKIAPTRIHIIPGK